MILSTHCYIEKEGKMLMLHRTKKKNDVMEGMWVGLGGKMESGESPEECIIREVYEESGLKVKSLALRGFITFPDFMGSGDWYMFVFICDDFEGELIDSDEGELAWIDKEHLNELPMFEGDRLFMKWMLEHPFFTAKLCYEGEKLVHHELCVYEKPHLIVQ